MSDTENLSAAEPIELPYRVGNALPDDFIEFVETTLRELLTADTREAAWCSQWAEHPAAVHRLYAMYAEWAEIELGQPDGLEGFLRVTLDHHLPLLTSKDAGLFKSCKDSHRAPKPLGG